MGVGRELCTSELSLSIISSAVKQLIIFVCIIYMCIWCLFMYI